MRSATRVLPAISAAVLCLVGSAAAQDLPIVHDGAWAAEKCKRYRTAWVEIASGQGMAGITSEFLASHELFLESGCIARADVCPRTEREIALANHLTIAAMNAGMASTFLPFACRPE